jgi:hypothetical protein
VDPTEDRQTRYHAIDNLRATMISIVMFGHALLPYVTFPRSFKDPQTHIGFDAIAIFLYGFAMPVFFVTAGFSTALIHQRKGLRGLGRNRVQRIFLPLLAAYVLLSPLTRAAFRFTRETAQSGSLQAGLDRVLLGDWIYWGKPSTALGLAMPVCQPRAIAAADAACRVDDGPRLRRLRRRCDDRTDAARTVRILRVRLAALPAPRPVADLPAAALAADRRRHPGIAIGGVVHAREARNAG